jgi:uncharacterized surface protein with fasciclin (FAS1) repeats
MIPTWPRCAFWGAQPSWRATKVKRRSKKVVTCHVVSGAYLEKCLTDFNNITHTWSPHDLYVPFGMHNLLEGQQRSKEGYNLSCRFRSISRKPPDVFQPYYTHMIPTCRRCAFSVVRPSEGKKKAKKVVTCHVVYGVYLEKRSTDFNAVYLFNYIFCGFYVYWPRGFPCIARLFSGWLELRST